MIDESVQVTVRICALKLTFEIYNHRIIKGIQIFECYLNSTEIPPQITYTVKIFTRPKTLMDNICSSRDTKPDIAKLEVQN